MVETRRARFKSAATLFISERTALRFKSWILRPVCTVSRRNPGQSRDGPRHTTGSSNGVFELAFETICDVVLGEGHFLGHAQTYDAMERDDFYPELADRTAPATWMEKSAENAWFRANARAREILNSHRPGYLPADITAAICDRFPIIQCD